MNPTLFAWIGQADLNASGEKPDSTPGPILAAVKIREFDRIVLLFNYKPEDRGRKYEAWLKEQTSAKIDFRPCTLVSPTDYRSIYEEVSKVTASLPDNHPMTFHLSPGTPAMATVWVLLAKTIYSDRCELLQASPERGVETVDLPFDIYAELGPRLLRQRDEEHIRLIQGLPAEAPEFDMIIHRCKPMKEQVAMARRFAPREVPILIQGESGTGKELFANAIQKASQRANKPYVTLNCGAIPPELVDAKFFGHKKNAFTGADRDQKGLFDEADSGTLFLDEIGELSPASQVRLLRVLQEGTFHRVGESKDCNVDVRVIAATHRDLFAMVAKGEFREDLFYRLAIGMIDLPPLRYREGDLGILVDRLLEEINVKLKEPGKGKRISAGGRSVLLHQPWPGNVRELKNVLIRSSIRANGNTISKGDVERSLFIHPTSCLGVMERPLGSGFSLNELIHEIQRVYIRRALEQAENQTQAAKKLLGFKSLKNLKDRMQQIGYKSETRHVQ